MSPRAACRLETLGYEQVHDYLPGKVDWLARGLPTEGEAPRESRVIDAVRADDVVTCTLDSPAGEVRERLASSSYGVAFVLSEGGVLLGRLPRSTLEDHPDGRVTDLMEPGPSTVRASLPLHEAYERMSRQALAALVLTGPDGRLLGIVRRGDVERLMTQPDGRADG